MIAMAGTAMWRAVCVAIALSAAAPALAQVKPPEGAPGAAPVAKADQFGDWVRQCDPPQDGKPGTCFILQKTIMKESGQQVMAIGVGYYGEKQVPAAIITAPLGIFLPVGLTLTVPGVEPVRVVVESCTPQGCRGGTALTDEILAAMKKGERAEIGMQDMRRRPVNLPISLKGFTAGFATLKKN